MKLIKYLHDLFLLLIVLLLFFLLIIILLLSSGGLSLLLTLRGLGSSSLLAGPLTEPLGQLLGGPLAPLVVLLLPGGLKVFSSDNFPASLVHLLPVVIGSGVSSALVLGVHADLGRVLAGQGLGVKTLLEGLGSELCLLPLLELLQVKLLGELPLLIVILVSLKLDNDLEKVLSLGLHLIRVHGLKLEGLDSDGQSNLLLLLELLLGLGELLAGVIARSTSNGLLLLVGVSLLCLLGIEHLLSLGLSLLQALLLLLGLLGLPVSLLPLHH